MLDPLPVFVRDGYRIRIRINMKWILSTGVVVYTKNVQYIWVLCWLNLIYPIESLVHIPWTIYLMWSHFQPPPHTHTVLFHILPNIALAYTHIRYTNHPTTFISNNEIQKNMKLNASSTKGRMTKGRTIIR